MVTSSYGRWNCRSTNDGSGANVASSRYEAWNALSQRRPGTDCRENLATTYVKSPLASNPEQQPIGESAFPKITQNILFREVTWPYRRRSVLVAAIRWGWGSQLTLFPNSGCSVILLHNSSGAGDLGQAAIDIEFAASHPGVKPAIAVNDVTNTCGGTLYVNGSGFLPNEKVSLTVKNAPGLKSPQKLGTTGTANASGNLTIQIPYSGDPYSGLPGCTSGSTATVVVIITASGEISGDASAEIYMKNCGITWGACPA